MISETHKKQLADRHNDGKPQWSMVDFKALEPMVEVLEYGAKKYSKDNWKKGLPYTKVSESLIRHLVAFLSGEYFDSESGLPHVGHIACNAMFLSHMALFRKDMDDRGVHVQGPEDKYCCGNWDENGICLCNKG